MNKKKIYVFFMLLMIVFSGMTGCKKTEKMHDGYYTAEMSDYSNGWKEFVTICVKDDKIVSVEYNAKNSSGFIKSWDMAYMRTMNAVKGTYPNRYTRTYAASFLESQDPNNITVVSGASTSGGNFVKMAAAVMEKAKAGDTSIAIVEYD